MSGFAHFHHGSSWEPAQSLSVRLHRDTMLNRESIPAEGRYYYTASIHSVLNGIDCFWWLTRIERPVRISDGYQKYHQRTVAASILPGSKLVCFSRPRLFATADAIIGAGPAQRPYHSERGRCNHRRFGRQGIDKKNLLIQIDGSERWLHFLDPVRSRLWPVIVMKV